MGPLNDEEKNGLIIDHAIDRAGVYALEQINIEGAIAWTFGKRFNPVKLINQRFINALHRRMYGDVWKWAGEYRTSERNLGIAYYLIPQEVQILVDDALYWIENDTYSPIETAVRFKHRLVSIHCFPNGNGRHSRLMADLIMEKLYQETNFTWGGSTLLKDDDKRRNYIRALKKADQGDYSDLMAFAQS